ncbi:MAG: arylsulfatase, partial [Planctomycetes bacterium]|nr:arylsulfatase [Planctomycetota bacterium]
KRRTFLKGVSLGAAGAAGAAATAGGRAARAADAAPGRAAGRRPNVILVLTDDQGYGDLSCLGNPVLKTPNIDRLHAESVRLTDFHVAPMCTPTRGQIMSGLDALRNRARHVCGGLTMLRTDVPTMADIFRAGGYRTGIFGKWHLGDQYPYLPHQRGFEEAVHHKSWGITSAADAWGNDYFDDQYLHNGRLRRYEGYCTDVWFREATAWMKACAARREPFFCYLPTNAPHGPLFVPERYAEPYRKPGVPANFFGMIACIDENMGRLMAWLDESGLAQDTILVFMTDNGGTGGVKLYNAGMRGGKTQLYDGGHRVPCFVRWPSGGLRPAGDAADLAAAQDLVPTLADLCSLPLPAGARLDGVSLAGILRGTGATPPERMVVVQYHIEIPKWNAAVLWKKWRLVKGEELYDIASDPGQQTNVADRRPDVLKAMRDHYERWWAEVEPVAREPCCVHIGSQHENPVTLCCADWYMIYADNSGHLQGGNNSYWNVRVERDGIYTFALHRWPPESGAALDAPLAGAGGPTAKGAPGKALPVAKARLQAGALDESKPAAPGQKAVTFTVALKAGKTRIQTWLYDKDGQELCGAYYTVVERA